ncbi:MAG: hypothetical protein MJ201_04250 [Mycoplasmoidaceae bacterium]|nr:hypothetical protein [Mycoplasmoidaceae bacterium]
MYPPLPKCNNAQNTRLAIVIVNKAFFKKPLTVCHTFLNIIRKSIPFQLTISTQKNDFCFLNSVLENVKPSVRAIIPETITAPRINNQPKVRPNTALEIAEITIIFVAQGMKGMIKTEIILSFFELELLANIKAGTLHPNAVSKLTTDLPEIPNLLKALSSKMLTLDNKPTCWIIVTHINRITILGINDSTVNKPPKIPLTIMLDTQSGALMLLNPVIINADKLFVGPTNAALKFCCNHPPA